MLETSIERTVSIADIACQSEVLPRHEAMRWYVWVLVCALVLYFGSCAPGILWQDSGLFQYRIWHNDIEGNLGLALSHPLYHMIGIAAKYIPISSFGHRINLISAVSAAFAVANVFLLVRLWVGRNMPAAVSAVTLALSHTVWLHASIAEVYTLYIALFTAELIFLFKYFQTGRVGYLYLVGLFNGLSIANHMWGIIPLGCYGLLAFVLLVSKRVRFRQLGLIILLWVVGAAPYEYLIVRNIFEGGGVSAVLASAVFGDGWQSTVLNTRLNKLIVLENFMFAVLNFPTPNVLLFLAGCVVLLKRAPSRSFRNIFLGMLVLFFVFAFRYMVPDRFVFFMPFYCLTAILIGLGAHILLERTNRRFVSRLVWLFCFFPMAAYIVVPALAQRRAMLQRGREIPHRNDYTYFLQPWKTRYRGAEDFANDVFDSVDRNAIVYADGTTLYPLLFAHEINGRRQDVTIVSKHGRINNLKDYGLEVVEKSGRPIYVVSPARGYCPKFLLENYDFERDFILFKGRRKSLNVSKAAQ